MPKTQERIETNIYRRLNTESLRIYKVDVRRNGKQFQCNHYTLEKAREWRDAVIAEVRQIRDKSKMNTIDIMRKIDNKVKIYDLSLESDSEQAFDDYADDPDNWDGCELVGFRD